EGAKRLAKMIPNLGRPPAAEEVMLLAVASQELTARDALSAVLNDPALRTKQLETLYNQRQRITDPELLAPVLTSAAREMLGSDSSTAQLDLFIRLATG